MIGLINSDRSAAPLAPTDWSGVWLGALFALLTIAGLENVAGQEKLLPVFHFNRLTTADGLPSNEIRSNVVVDRQGFIWVGTAGGGLARLNGYGCKVYRNVPDDHRSLPSNAVMALWVDKRGLIWVGTYDSGFSLFDAANDRFVNFLSRDSTGMLEGTKSCFLIREDRAGNIWFSSDENKVVMADMTSLMHETNADSVSAHLRFHAFQLEGLGGFVNIDNWNQKTLLFGTRTGLRTYDLVTRQLSRLHLPATSEIDLDTAWVICTWWQTPERLWIATHSRGLYLFDRSSNSLTGYHKRPSRGHDPRDDLATDMLIDGGGRLWIATKASLDLFDPISGVYIEYLTSGPARAQHPYLLSVDRMGRFWISTEADGLYCLTPRSLLLRHYSLKTVNGTTRRLESIDEGGNGSYWFATGGEVVRIRLADLSVLQTVDLFKKERRNSDYPSVWDSYRDGRGTIWYASEGFGLIRFKPATGAVTRFRLSSQYGGSNTAGWVGDIFKSITGGMGDSLWIGSPQDGLLHFDTRSNTFTRHPEVGNVSLHAVQEVLKNRDGKIWIGDERAGVVVLDPRTGQVDHYTHDPGRQGSISDDRAWSVYQDPGGKIWVGTQDLNLWNPEARSFSHFTNDPFKGSLFVKPLGNDGIGNLWVFYYNLGVGTLEEERRIFRNFDWSDGLCGGQIYRMSHLDDGRVILLGSGGMNIFHPESLTIAQPPPQLVLTRMLVNDSIDVSAHKLSAGALRLRHDQGVIEIEFAAIDPGQTHLIDYRYRLEGLEDAWVNPGGRRFVRYPGLSPGNYLFRVRASNRFNRWPDQETVLAVTIDPPWWRTWLAYGMYGLLLVGLVSSAYRIRVRQLFLKQRAEHLVEVDRMKSRFFANISHEFRTPLTLILGPIENIRSRVQDDSIRTDLNLMQRNAHRLLKLINQLLDLSKLEAGAMKLRASRTKIVPLVRGLAYSFQTSAGMKEIGLEVLSEDEEVEVYCDRDMIEKIISNLVSNAFKFTGAGGRVLVSIRPRRDVQLNAPARSGCVDIDVVDTGVGISPEQLERIFVRFYQVDESQTREREGSGIGLALVKELVELHHGTLQVQSEVGRGTTFTVRLPLGRSHLRDEEVVEAPAVDETAQHDPMAAPEIDRIGESEVIQEPLTARDQRPIVLLVEDNAEVRAYMKDFLVASYQVVEAGDGATGIAKALETIPDLVISDVMMPKKDGYEVCRTLKLDERASHIPIVLLTAKAASENKIEGLETGADDYLVKPFEPKELLARVRNLIDQRRKLRKRFSAGQVLKPGEITVSSVDDALLQKMKACVERHMTEESFGAEGLRSEVGMSRTQLHRKLTALTGMPASDFIRYLRLHRAMDLLRQNAATVSEIAFMVGFSSPAYFTKCFREQFGTTPSEVRRPRQ